MPSNEEKSFSFSLTKFDQMKKYFPSYSDDTRKTETKEK